MTKDVFDHVLGATSSRRRSESALVLEAVVDEGLTLQFASAELRADREVVCAAVREDGRTLEFASESLRDIPETSFLPRGRQQFKSSRT